MKRAPLLMSIAVLALAGCSTTAHAPESAGVQAPDLAYLTSAYQLIQFDIAICNKVTPDTAPDYGKMAVAKICGDAEKYQPVLAQEAAAVGAQLPNAPDYDHLAEETSMTYGVNGQGKEDQQGTITPAQYNVLYPSEFTLFLRYEIASHESALADFQEEARSGTNPSLRENAAKFEPLILENLELLQATERQAKDH